jgi:hypothetical protein
MNGETQNTNPAAGAGSDDIKNIMGGMQGAEPDPKPAGNGGDNGAGNKPNADGNDGGKEAPNPAWMEQIGDITKDAAAAEKLKKFGKVGDLAKTYLELEGKLGNSITKPGENASAEEIENFYRGLGKPESADKYSIEGDDAKMFREMAFKNNLTDAQAKAFYQSLQEVGASAMKNAAEQQKAAFEAQAHETQTALRKEYGNDYPVKIEMLKRGVAAYGGQSLAAKLDKAGLLGDYEVVKMFINLGEMSAEAGSPGNTNGKADDYKSIPEGGTFSFYKEKK